MIDVMKQTVNIIQDYTKVVEVSPTTIIKNSGDDRDLGVML